MIVCQGCGNRNPDGTDFCTSCGRYLGWSGTQASEPPRSALVIQLPEGDLRVEPGSEAGVELQVRNTGAIVDAFDVHVGGAERAWITAEPAQIRLFPGTGETVRLRLAPPRRPDVRAGATTLVIQVTSSTDARVGAEERRQVVVGIYRDLTATLVPRHSEGVTSATHRLQVANGGNAPVEARVLATDPDERLAFDVRPSALLRLEPGASGLVTIEVTPRRPLEWRQQTAWPFQVRLEPADGPPVAVDGIMLQLPPPVAREEVVETAPEPPPARRRGCCLVGAALLGLLAAGAGIAAAFVLLNPETNPPPPAPTSSASNRVVVAVPHVVDTAEATAAQRLRAAGFGVRSVAVCSGSVRAGNVRQVLTDAGTDRDGVIVDDTAGVTAAGRSLARGAPLVMKISTGRACPS